MDTSEIKLLLNHHKLNYDPTNRDIFDKIFRNSKSEDCSSIVLIGNTGTGKSTLGNRLILDTSEKGTIGFETSSDVKSCTENIEKRYVVKKRSVVFAIVDTPGLDDGEGRDAKFMNDFIYYFSRYPIGKKLICVTIDSGTKKFSHKTKLIFKVAHGLFGNVFWENLCVIVTGADNVKDMEELQKRCLGFKEELQSEFGKKFGMINLPNFYVMGHHNYKPIVLKLFEEAYGREPFSCPLLNAVKKYHLEGNFIKSVTDGVNVAAMMEKQIKNIQDKEAQHYAHTHVTKCFASNMCVMVKNCDDKITRKYLSEIEIGDYVMVKNLNFTENIFEKVLHRAHYSPKDGSENATKMITLVAAYSHYSITLTPDHMLFVDSNKILKSAKQVKIGDTIWAENGTRPQKVVNIVTTSSTGRSIFTSSGYILINGIMASCYTGKDQNDHNLQHNTFINAYRFLHPILNVFLSAQNVENFGIYIRTQVYYNVLKPLINNNLSFYIINYIKQVISAIILCAMLVLVLLLT